MAELVIKRNINPQIFIKSMIQLYIRIVVALGFTVSSVSTMAFYSQKENLFIDDETPLIPLGQYFENKPKAFGLITNKSKSIERDGYLCYADSFEEYRDNCVTLAPYKNMNWVSF